MVKDGIYYALGMVAAATLLYWATRWWWLAAIPLLLGAFFLWFFRDPERQVPSEPGLIVSPADGLVTDVSNFGAEAKTRISIFLNVFNVHVNRSPIGGIVTAVQYQKGKFGNAMAGHSSEHNEQNIVTVEGEGHSVTFKQIAGLLARRIVFSKSIGDTVSRGERIGLIKFGSRVDVILERGINPTVKIGDKVTGGSSVIAKAEPGK